MLYIGTKSCADPGDANVTRGCLECYVMLHGATFHLNYFTNLTNLTSLDLDWGAQRMVDNLPSIWVVDQPGKSKSATGH